MNFACFACEFEMESVEIFMKECSNFDEDLVVYLNSEGGDIDAAAVFVDFINKYEKDVTLIAIGELCSAALISFLISNSKKIVKCPIGIHHLITYTTDTRTLKKSDLITEIMCKDTDKKNQEYLRLLKTLNVPENFINDIANGKDVVIDSDELSREAKIAEKLFYKPKGVLV